MNFSNFNVSTRLAIGFTTLFLGALLLAVAGWYGINRQSHTANIAIEQDVAFSQTIANLRARVQMMRRYEKDTLLYVADPVRLKAAHDQWEASRKRAGELMAKARETATSDSEKKLLGDLDTALGRYTTGFENLYTAIKSGQYQSAEQANKKVDDFRQVVRDTETITGELFDGASKRIETVKPALAGIAREVMITLAAVAAIVLVLAILIGILISRSITVPVAEAVRVAEALARGDLGQKVEAKSRDEMGRLMLALAGTVGQLSSMVNRIKQTTDTVNTASREIAQGNADLSTRTEQQASALEETSASMQQMTATVGQNAQNAKKANELAAQASGVAAKGGEVVREAVDTMNGITESSKKIADIIGVIDGIAFQTNILALNAAVEAARAGEQGRGFAVVASEVRNLAQRSAAAAKEIKGLITDSVAKVDAGSRQVNDAGRTMEEIVGSVKKVSTLIAEITAASQEQAQGIEQVSETMTQLEKVTQQNAAMVEEASAAAGSLEEQSRELAGAVAAFRLADETQVVAAPKAQRSAPRSIEAAPKKERAAAKSPTTLAAPARPQHAALAAPAKNPQARGTPAKDDNWQEF
jgi:methyl-accepting chemotaxis protein